jgi:hypothetical protein
MATAVGVLGSALLKVELCSAVAVSQVRTSPSSVVAATQVPSGEIATELNLSN